MDIELQRRTADLRSVADIRLTSLEDGPGRGQRLLIARNAHGVAFEVAVDKGFDIAGLSFRGTNIGWHSPCRWPSRHTTQDPRKDGASYATSTVSW